MSKEVFDTLILEWEDEDSSPSPVFDDIKPVDEVEPGKMQARFLVKRRATLLEMIGRFSLAEKLSSILSGSLHEHLLLGFCIMVLVNPYKIKYLKGNGIDSLIDAGEYDDETGEMFIPKRDFFTFCKDKNIDSTLLSWLEENGFTYTDNERIIFRNNFKRGKIFLSS